MKIVLTTGHKVAFLFGSYDCFNRLVLKFSFSITATLRLGSGIGFYKRRL